MRRGRAIGERQAVRVEHASLRAESVEDASRFERQKTTVGALAQGPIEQQDARSDA